MVSLSLPREFNIPSNKLQLATKLILASFLIGVKAYASDGAENTNPGLQLKPYTAQYLTKTRGISMTLDRKLIRNANDRYQLSNGGSKLIAGFRESSEFEVQDSQVVPISYVYQGSGLMNRRREVHFTPGSDTIRSLYKEKWYDLPYSEGTYDRMSQLEQMRLQLLLSESPRDSVQVTIADGKRVKTRQIDFVGEEILKTRMGDIKTLHFRRVHDKPDRNSDTWLAPEWDYLMVKTVHIEDGSKVEVNIVAASMEGVPLSGQ